MSFSIFSSSVDVEDVETRLWPVHEVVCVSGRDVKYGFNLVLITQSLQAGWQRW